MNSILLSTREIWIRDRGVERGIALGRAEAFRACIELLESRKRYWDGGDLARVGEYSNFVKELDHLIEQMESVRDGKDGRP